MADEPKTLATIEAGDELVLWSGRVKTASLVRVQRTTRTQILVKGHRYYRKDGQVMGAGLAWSSPNHIEVLDDSNRHVAEAHMADTAASALMTKLRQLERRQGFGVCLPELREAFAKVNNTDG